MTPVDKTPLQTQIETIQHSVHYQNRTIVYRPPQMPGGGPPCIWDNGPTQRAGSCWVCVLCGSTSACG